MRVIISGGGTGGHVYPALAVANKLLALNPAEAQHARLAAPQANGKGSGAELLYVGSQGGIEETLVNQAGLPQQVIPAGGLRGLAPWRIAANLVKLARGFAAAQRIVRQFAPDVVFEALCCNEGLFSVCANGIDFYRLFVDEFAEVVELADNGLFRTEQLE